VENFDLKKKTFGITIPEKKSGFNNSCNVEKEKKKTKRIKKKLENTSTWITLIYYTSMSIHFFYLFFAAFTTFKHCNNTLNSIL
jgi:hypothetical protein